MKEVTSNNERSTTQKPKTQTNSPQRFQTTEKHKYPEAYIIISSFQIQTQAQATPANHNATSKNHQHPFHLFNRRPQNNKKFTQIPPPSEKTATKTQKDQIFTIISKI